MAEGDGFATAGDLDAMLPGLDILSLHCPLTAATRNLIDARRLSLMKPDAVIVNTARGGIIDEAALAQALDARTIAGAALDSFATEPPASDNPLWAQPNRRWRDDSRKSSSRSVIIRGMWKSGPRRGAKTW